jgi:hypothetical protein
MVGAIVIRNNLFSHLPMPKSELLPGVSPDRCLPQSACDAHGTMRGARRRAVVRDTLQIALLMAVNYLFMYWPASRMPFLERKESLLLLALVNGLVIVSVVLTRLIPRWTARRVAETWSRSEQEILRQQLSRDASRRTSAALRRP